MAAAARSALLNHLRVHVQAVPRNPSYTLSFNAIRRRFLSEEVRGSFLDKSEVTDRVISVVKNFQKVDPSKVKSATSKRNTFNNLLLSVF
jgi:NADH dehydrogenase (ubiquinone) 1 alpha/beta subcomplex 1